MAGVVWGYNTSGHLADVPGRAGWERKSRRGGAG